MRIQIAEVHKRYRAVLNATASDDGGDHMGDFIAWTADSSNQFDSEAEEFIDGVLLALAKAMWNSVRNDPSHPLFRAARRHLATLKAEHSTAIAQLGCLEAAPASEDMSPCKDAVTGLVLDVVQFVRDICFDESQLANRSRVQLEDTAMLLGCLDELVAGLTLYRHNYMSQAGAHARTVLETVELLELFEAHPECRDAWRSMKPGDVPAKEMRPWSIREMTGKAGRSDLYNLLCDVSTHPRNLWVLSRVSLSSSDDGRVGADTVSAVVSFAGTRDPILSAVVSVALVFVAALVALRLTLGSLSEAALASNTQRASDLLSRSHVVLVDCLASSGNPMIAGLSDILLELRTGIV